MTPSDLRFTLLCLLAVLVLATVAERTRWRETKHVEGVAIPALLERGGR